MCHFASWIEIDGETLFLTDDHIKDKKGREIKDMIRDDFRGHGAIRAYYDITRGRGVDKECTDFSAPDNFPAKVADAVKAGKMKMFGEPEGLLSAAAWTEYEKVCAPARAEYNKVCAAARAEYEKVCAPARAEYQKVCRNSFWGLFADPDNRAGAWK